MYPCPYIDYLIYFHVERDYFECHEVLEEFWKEAPIGKRQTHWVGLIQVAVGLYHHRRGNRKGAVRMFEKAHTIVCHHRKSFKELGLDPDRLLEQLSNQINVIKHQQIPFRDMNLPLSNEVISACKVRCKQLGKSWGLMTSQNISDFLLHKHMLRDRSAVISERLQQLQVRSKKNS